jgi:hypothetical protein
VWGGRVSPLLLLHMATATLTPDNDAVLAEIFVAAPDLRPGGKWVSEGVGADGTKFTIEGEYLEVDLADWCIRGLRASRDY